MLLQEELMGVNEDDRLERVMLGNKGTNRKITMKSKSKVIRVLTRMGAVREKENELTGNKLEL